MSGEKQIKVPISIQINQIEAAHPPVRMLLVVMRESFRNAGFLRHVAEGFHFRSCYYFFSRGNALSYCKTTEHREAKAEHCRSNRPEASVHRISGVVELAAFR